jgi:AcrR family transcriptional regulator
MGSLSQPSRAERADAAANRVRILDAAREVFAARGLEAEMKDIAARASVGVGTLYRHFDSRDDLLGALIRETSKEMLDRFRTAVRDQSPEAAFRAIIQASAETLERFGALVDVAMAGTIPGAGDSVGEFKGLMTDLLRRGITEGLFRPDLDAEVATGALESIFHSGTMAGLVARRGLPAACDAISDFFLAAFRVR